MPEGTILKVLSKTWILQNAKTNIRNARSGSCCHFLFLRWLKNLKEGIKEILYQTYPGVYPQICYIDKDKSFNWFAVDIVKERDVRPKRNDEILDAIIKKVGRGHCALSEITNPYAENVFPRGQKFDIRCEISNLY